MTHKTKPITNGDHARSAEFWAKVDKSGDCWIWTGVDNGHGYGRFRGLMAHRFAYAEKNGDLPPGALLDHTCSNRACVNPAHLRIVTNKQNMEHRSAANRNSKSGVRGVQWKSRDKCWQVDIRHNGKHYYGGYFKSLADAEAAAIRLRNRLFTHNDADRIAA